MPSRESPDSGGGHSHAEAHTAVFLTSRRIAAVSLIVTACLLALKLAVGIISDSVAVLSDAVDSGTDLAGGAAAFVSLRIAAQPADEDHPYGHGKVEAVSASVAATVVGLGGGLITFQAVRRLIDGSPEIDVDIGLAAMAIAAVANLVMAALMRREARRSGSMALTAESTHLQTNVVQAGAIILGLALVGITNERLFDPITALLLAAYMAWTAIRLVRTALTDIMDESLPDAELVAIEEVLRSHKSEVLGYHRLRTRRAGSTRHIDMHLIFEADRTVVEVHDASDHIEADIQTRLPGAEVVIHPEPDEGQERTPLA
ncbi:MAG: cation transporter [Chloroflexi bacterium]|nr:MAG: cation transporter [Chloroflexota bacterium]